MLYWVTTCFAFNLLSPLTGQNCTYARLNGVGSAVMRDHTEGAEVTCIKNP